MKDRSMRNTAAEKIEESGAADFPALAIPAAWTMLEDGDSRLDLDPTTGLDRYGCAALPQSGAAELASSTASTVSLAGLAAAEALWRHFAEAETVESRERVAAAAADVITKDLLTAVGIGPREKAAPVLAASGTTAILMATGLALDSAMEPALAVIVGAEETGTGVIAAATGRHPCARTPLGTQVGPGWRVAGYPADFATATVAIRDETGHPLSAGAVFDRVLRAVARGRAAGRRVVVTVLESSKTGLVAPGIAAVLELRERFPDVAVIVDACQWRTGSAVLRRYLAAGCIVVVSGSKFYGGPPFSGALLVPSALAQGRTPLPEGLAAYSWRGDWPAEWDNRCAGLPRRANPGLLLRWRAALAEIAAFRALPPQRVTELLAVFHEIVQLEASACGFALLPPPPPVASVDDAEPWAGLPSIFPVAVARPDGGWFGVEALGVLQSLLRQNAGPRLGAEATLHERTIASRACYVGQPVALGSGLAVLRIAVGARLLTAADSRGGPVLLHRDVADSLRKLAMIVKRLG